MSAFSREALLAAVRARAAERRRAQPLERLQDLVAPDSWRRERFLQAVQRPELSLIAVCQRRAPWSGVQLEESARPGTRPARLPLPGPRWFAFVDACRAGGAAMLGVVTEEDHFGGTLEDLQTVAHARLPRLRLDFPLDLGMVYESCLGGADALRLVAADLSDSELRTLRESCRELGLAVVIDVHERGELARALSVEPESICACARDPRTGALVPGRAEELLSAIPSGPIKFAAGGITSLASARAMRAAGAQALRVGEALARSSDPAALLAELRKGL